MVHKVVCFGQARPTFKTSWLKWIDFFRISAKWPEVFSKTEKIIIFNLI
jgi:hypothetical protein